MLTQQQRRRCLHAQPFRGDRREHAHPEQYTCDTRGGAPSSAIVAYTNNQHPNTTQNSRNGSAPVKIE
jgi:hypothetical protein